MTRVNKAFSGESSNAKNMGPDALAYDKVAQGDLGKPVTGKAAGAGQKPGTKLGLVGKNLSDVPLIADAAKKGVSTAHDGKQFDAKFWASGSHTQFDEKGHWYNDEGKSKDAGL